MCSSDLGESRKTDLDIKKDLVGADEQALARSADDTTADERQQLGTRDAGEDDGEAIATDAPGYGAFAGHPGKPLHYRGDDVVAGGKSVDTVDAVEIPDVDDREPEDGAVRAREFELLVERRQKARPIDQRGHH